MTIPQRSKNKGSHKKMMFMMNQKAFIRGKDLDDLSEIEKEVIQEEKEIGEIESRFSDWKKQNNK